MHRSDFCISGMFRDVFLFHDFLRMRALFLLIVLSSLLLLLMREAGIISSYPPSFFGLPSLAQFAGGLLFGAGMVLAGGCFIGTLYKVGAGKTVSFFSLIGILCGSALYAEGYPVIAPLIRGTALLSDKTALEHIAGSSWIPVLILLLPFTFFAWKWRRRNVWSQKAYAEGYIDPWKAAVLMSLLISLSYALVNRPLSVTAGFGKITAFLESLFVPGHPESLLFFNQVSYRLVGNSAFAERMGPGLDSITRTQLLLIAGIIFGGFISAFRLGEFRISVLPPFRQVVSAFSGGVLMAGGACASSGCNLWHLLGGLPVFALQSLLFLAGLLPGAYLGTLALKKVIADAR
ncbi:MAG: YeeE/YedE family protein [Nitrospirota bacterium]